MLIQICLEKIRFIRKRQGQSLNSSLVERKQFSQCSPCKIICCHGTSKLFRFGDHRPSLAPFSPFIIIFIFTHTYIHVIHLYNNRTIICTLYIKMNARYTLYNTYKSVFDLWSSQNNRIIFEPNGMPFGSQPYRI